MDFRGKNIDLVGRLRLWFGLSGLIIAIGLGALLGPGLNLGIDFRGGSQFIYRMPEATRPASSAAQVETIERVNDALVASGLLNTRTQIAGDSDIIVQVPALTDSQRAAQEGVTNAAVASALGVEAIAPEGREFVGPVIGEELRRNAVLGVLFGVLAIAVWIFIRYNFAGDGVRYSVASIVALVHDVLILLGLFALIGAFDQRIEVDSTFIAALLTVVGYSINDSVVIFDRLRENLRNRRRESFESAINASLLETMSRSINTGLTILLMLFVLLFFGGQSIYNFILAMLLGIGAGLYSSIFVAPMVLVAWHRFDQRRAAQIKARRLARPDVLVRETPRAKERARRSDALKTRGK